MIYWVDQMSWHELGFIKDASSCPHGWLMSIGLCMGNIRARASTAVPVMTSADWQKYSTVLDSSLLFFQLFFLSLKYREVNSEVTN